MPRVVPDRLAQEPHEGRASWTLKVLSCFADSPPGWDPDRRRLGPYPCLRMIHPARRSNIRGRRVVFQHVGVGSASRRADRASHLGSSGCNSRRQEWHRLGSVFRGSADCESAPNRDPAEFLAYSVGQPCKMTAWVGPQSAPIGTGGGALGGAERGGTEFRVGSACLTGFL